MFNFNNMLHDERARCLRALPKFSGTVLSAGCAGTWFFKWFEECTGHKGKHIGVELYSQKPSDLPPNVEWIANSVGDMCDVENASIDVVFSGQNIEHLTEKDVVGFLIESNRILKDGGLLVIDSPNRTSTQQHDWTQSEHTLEFTVDEIMSLLHAAGFDVLETRGIWLVRDPVSKMSFDLLSCNDGELDYDERRYMARSHAEDSFIWWINASKCRPANPEMILSLVTKIFFKRYNQFVIGRFDSGVGTKQWSWGSSTVRINPGDDGFALYGPYIPLSDGKYQAIFYLKNESDLVSEFLEIVLDIVSDCGAVTHAKMIIAPRDLAENKRWTAFPVIFAIDKYVTGIETRIKVKNYHGLISPNVNILKD